jgi:hypothetical protein
LRRRFYFPRPFNPFSPPFHGLRTRQTTIIPNFYLSLLGLTTFRVSNRTIWEDTEMVQGDTIAFIRSETVRFDGRQRRGSAGQGVPDLEK